MKLVWISPWELPGPIAVYSYPLWPMLAKKAGGGASPRSRSHAQADLIQVDRRFRTSGVLQKLMRLNPEVVHLQFGFNDRPVGLASILRLQVLVKRIKTKLSNTKIVITIHPLVERIPKSRLRLLPQSKKKPAQVLLQVFTQVDGVIVHGQSQLAQMRDLGAQNIELMPRYLLTSGVQGTVSRDEAKHPEGHTVLVLGDYSVHSSNPWPEFCREALGYCDSQIKMRFAGIESTRLCKNRRLALQNISKNTTFAQRLEYVTLNPVGDWDILFRGIDLVIVPESAPVGTQGLNLLVRALGRGLPVIAANQAGFKELLDESPDLFALFNPESSKDLATQILRLFKDADLRKKLKQSARHFTLEHGVDQLIEMHLAYYQSLLLRAAAPTPSH